MESKVAERPSLRQRLERCLKIAMSREDLGCQIPHIVLALADVMKDPNYHSPMMEGWCNYFLERNEPKGTEKLVIFRSAEYQTVDMVVKVENYDEGFLIAASNADYAWQDTEDEWCEFMLTRLLEAGYKVEVVEYETVNT